MISSPRRWRLRTKIVAAILALYIAVTACTGAATVILSQRSLVHQVDQELQDAQAQIGVPRTGMRIPRERLGTPHHAAPGLGNILRLTFKANSTTVSENFVSTYTGTATKLTNKQINILASAGLRPPQPQTVSLGGSVGRYRVISIPRLNGDTTIVGFPLAPIDADVKQMVTIVSLLGLLGLLAVGSAGTYLINRNLRPLRRVADTAERVSQAPLAEGSARTKERVPAIDTDAKTEVGTVGLALNNLLDHVDSALDSRHESEMQVRQFVADASHELRTPLASIRGYAELSRKEREPVPPSVTHALSRIESEASRMTTLVEDLLLLARLDAGRELEHAPVDLTRVVVESLSDLHAAGPDHVWLLDLPDDIEDFPEVIGDEARLRQVVINLLANARRHTPPGTKVTAGLARQGDQVLITVLDDGPGIPAEFLPHLFERFTRGDTARTRTEGSTGLGLSIVDAVVSAHHGHVEVESEPGHTKFTVYVPIESAQASDTGATKATL